MKTGKNISIKLFVVCLLTGYLFIALTNIFYLPKYNSAKAKGSIASNYSSVHPNNYNAANGTYLLLHRAFKSVKENKRDPASILLQFAIITSFGFYVIAASGIARKSNSQRPSFYYHQYFYLSFCTLRI